MGKKEEPGRDIGKLEGDVSKFLPSLASVASSAALSSSPLPSSATRPSDISSSSLDLFFNYYFTWDWKEVLAFDNFALGKMGFVC